MKCRCLEETFPNIHQRDEIWSNWMWKYYSLEVDVENKPYPEGANVADAHANRAIFLDHFANWGGLYGCSQQFFSPRTIYLVLFKQFTYFVYSYWGK